MNVENGSQADAKKRLPHRHFAPIQDSAAQKLKNHPDFAAFIQSLDASVTDRIPTVAWAEGLGDNDVRLFHNVILSSKYPESWESYQDVVSLCVRYLADHLKHRNGTVRSKAAYALERFGRQAKDVLSALIDALADSEDDVRLGITRTLKAIGPEARMAAPVLFMLATKNPSRPKDSWICSAARSAVRAILGIGPLTLSFCIIVNNIDKYFYLNNNYESFVDQLRKHGYLAESREKAGLEAGRSGRTSGGEAENYDALRLELARETHRFREDQAKRLGVALNTRIQSMSHETLDQKKELARWVNDQLEPLGLAVKCPKTGQPAKLWGIKGRCHPGEMNGFFCFEIQRDGKRVKTAYSDQLPEVNLTDATPSLEAEVVWQKSVGKKESRRGRGRS